MTYTHKLARRLAISRNLAMLPAALVLFAACAGDTTAPEAPTATTPSAPTTPVGFRILPGTVTIEIDQRVRFRGELRTSTGAVYAPPVSWEASGGSIDSSGYFAAGRPGTYHIIARRPAAPGPRDTRRDLPRDAVRAQLRQLPDTSTVIVVVRQPKLDDIRVTPRGARLEVGETRAFTASGVLADGSKAPIGVDWSATGGTIDPAGTYQAGTVPGTYQVIATNTRGTVADTVTVRILVADSASAPQPEPTPEPTPEPSPEPTPEPEQPILARVVLRPGSVVLATQTTQQFTAFGRTASGDSIAVDVTFNATGGTITSDGLYTAGASGGTYHVVASAEGQADTAVVSLAVTSGGAGVAGIPFGPYGAWDGATLKTGAAIFTGSIGSVSASSLVSRIDEARRRGVKLMTAMTGGHDPYLTDGVFDMAKWKARMDTYNTPTLRQAVAAAVADGILIGNSVMDEPHVYGLGDGNTWGPKGTMTKARVDEMCGYVKAIFPTLPVGVVHQHDAFEPDKSYRVCEFIVSQYAQRYGSVTAFRDAALALGRRDGIAIAFSLNILNGGIQAARDGQWNCSLATTGGRGTYDPNCRMTAAQVREYGLVLGPAGCALMMWRYDDAFMANAANQQAFGEIARQLAAQAGRPCRRT
jgi:hypothetical protein